MNKKMTIIDGISALLALVVIIIVVFIFVKTRTSKEEMYSEVLITQF